MAREHCTFARGLIDEAQVDIVHGHSSHHVKGMEVYRGRLILFGCGDLINDYEGIGERESYRDDLVLVYAVACRSCDGEVQSVEMTPFQIRKFQLRYARHRDSSWLAGILSREGEQFGTWVELIPDGRLALRWK